VHPQVQHGRREHEGQEEAVVALRAARAQHARSACEQTLRCACKHAALVPARAACMQVVCDSLCESSSEAVHASPETVCAPEADRPPPTGGAGLHD
jgi:hypothetical protein